MPFIAPRGWGRLTRRAVLCALVSAVVGLAGLWPAVAAELETVEIVSKSGVHVFAVEIARSNEERARGLMHRRELPEGRGMLFDFAPEQEVSMWMKNTFVSLDMIFIKGDGRIHRIAENTTPESLAIIASGGPVRAVLEVVAGTTRKLGIAPGDRVAASLFRR